MSTKNKDNHVRYEVIVQEDSTTGDVILPIPLPILQKLGWKEEDNVELSINEDGTIFLTKANV